MPALDPATREELEARLRFYRELGLTDFYRRPVGLARTADSAMDAPVASSTETLGAPSIPKERVGEQQINSATLEETTLIPPRKPFQPAPPIGTEVASHDRASALQLIREDLGDCTRCALHKGRNKIVFADGDANARLMFVGEGPGADEDAQGLPFVGRAGQLLNNMIAAMGLKREEVYIANVVKCRPPQNRTPEPEEANTCSPFLFRQIDVVRPEVIVALGATAATYLLGQRQPLAGLRGRTHAFRGSKLIVTYHPAFLLRDPRQKKEAWADLQIAMRELGLKPVAKTVS
ncbi:uracil-DNA glycosylase [Telmatobacter sp. DSM 110680]|uniref:Type-4 uracil-DNA glycosylase n=1 Tax=Telmatobacter sp. DSM 110680 TaxID=3036704 RepID=A0AAU7DHB6_9BACT